MTILDLQRRIREAGRIRIGQQVATKNGKTRPAKLETFRITSPDRRAIEGVAELYGGEPARWQAPSGPQWECVTTSDELHVIVPPSEMAFSQWYETWSGGGCARRCDGVTEQLTDGPCLCDPEARECKPTTRLSVMLRDLAGLGVWRLESHGHYAAVELAGAVQVCMAAAGAGVMLPARLRLEPRVVKRQGEQTRNFAVPVLDVEITPAQLLGGGGGGVALNAGAVAGAPALGPAIPGDTPALAAGQEPEAPQLLTPVPETVRERPAPSVAEQAARAAQPDAGKRRANAAQPIPPTGLEPRTAAEASAEAAPEPEPDLEDLTVAQLKLRCRRADVPVSGTKEELIARLRGDETSGSSTSSEAPREARDEPEADPTPQGQGTPPQETPPPPEDEGSDERRPFDRDGAQKAFHAQLHELGLDYEDEVKPWMLRQERIGVSLSKLPDAQLSVLLDAMDKRPDEFVASVREHVGESSSVGDHGEGSPAEDAPPPEGDKPANNSPADVTPPEEGDDLAARAYRHAAERSPVGLLQKRIREAWGVLSVADHDTYAASWERVSGWLGASASTEDWSAASELDLRREAEDLTRAVSLLKADGKVR